MRKEGEMGEGIRSSGGKMEQDNRRVGKKEG